MKKTSVLIALFTFISISVYSQSAIVPVGGDGQSNNGSVSYSVGQIAVQISSNSNGSVFIAEGVQQPYEIQTIGVDDYPGITMEAVVYPNPTNDCVQLSIRNYDLPADGLTVQLYDVDGRLLEVFTVSGPETRFDLSRYPSAVYQLRVHDGRRLLKTFKIIKNHI